MPSMLVENIHEIRIPFAEPLFLITPSSSLSDVKRRSVIISIPNINVMIIHATLSFFESCQSGVLPESSLSLEINLSGYIVTGNANLSMDEKPSSVFV